jgi:uncharacterized protein
MNSLPDKSDQLLVCLRELGSCAVAYSGGVDSAVVAFAAHEALGARALAVTGISPSLASGEREAARELARQIGIRHLELATDEINRPAYSANQFDRCFHCKTELYSQMQRHLAEWGVEHLVNGTNADDLGDYRPGLRAADDFRVVSPLAELGLTKSDVRQLAQLWRLPVADKPAAPCLASRIAYGQEVTRERLEQIDRAEAWLRQQGFVDTRVRYHPGDLARLEVPLDDLPRLSSEPLRSQVAHQLEQLGFKFVTLDLQGRRSGSLNTLIPLAELEQTAAADCAPSSRTHSLRQE